MTQTGKILIEALDIYAHHGVFAEEERLGQRFTLDLALLANIGAAAITDALDDTVDYGKVVAVVVEAFTTQRFKLLEAAARCVAQAVLAGFPRVDAVEITLRKPAPPIPAILAAVGVRLEVRRGD